MYSITPSQFSPLVIRSSTPEAQSMGSSLKGSHLMPKNKKLIGRTISRKQLSGSYLIGTIDMSFTQMVFVYVIIRTMRITRRNSGNINEEINSVSSI